MEDLILLMEPATQESQSVVSEAVVRDRLH